MARFLTCGDVSRPDPDTRTLNGRGGEPARPESRPAEVDGPAGHAGRPVDTAATEAVGGSRGAGSAGAGEQEDPDQPQHSDRLRPPGVLDLEELLGDHLNTRVIGRRGRQAGRVIIEFANLDDLERIYRVMIGEG